PADHIYSLSLHDALPIYLIPLARGEVLGAFGLTEPNAGSDAGGTKTTAIEDGNDFVINGEKSFITNASFASAIIVTAITGKDKQDRKSTRLNSSHVSISY